MSSFLHSARPLAKLLLVVGGGAGAVWLASGIGGNERVEIVVGSPNAHPAQAPQGSTPASEGLAGAQLGDESPTANDADAEDGEGGFSCEHGSTTGCDVSIEPTELADLSSTLGEPRLLEFTSAYCSACAASEAAVSKAVEDCGDHASTSLKKVSVDQPAGAALAKHYKVDRLPTFLAVNEAGGEESRLVGKQDAAALMNALDSVRPCREAPQG